MVFEAYSRNILVCNVKDKNQKIFKWAKHKIQYPDEGSAATPKWDIILGWDQVVFFFEYNELYIGDDDPKDDHDDDAKWEECVFIWCLDLLNNDGRWYPSNKTLNAPMYSRHYYPSINKFSWEEHLMQ